MIRGAVDPGPHAAARRRALPARRRQARTVPGAPVGLWLGAYKPRMLALTGRLADGWLPSLGYAAPEELAGMNERIDQAALDAGRSPQDVRRLFNISGSFAGSRLPAGPAARSGSSSSPGWRSTRGSAGSC